jgi:hypothetical protein
MNPTTRRTFLKQASIATLAGFSLSSEAAARKDPKAVPASVVPWYRRTLRWGQTNITEMDPARYDIAWWRQHWKRTQTQGVIVNAGGIVAYYPSRVPLHRPAQHLGGRDLFGELCRAAHEEGIVVFARMDSNRAHEEFHRAHPDWFAVDAAGNPHKAGELFITCVNGPYYEEHIPAILREIVQRYRPEGFTDNSWSGLGRGTICYCENCRRKFRERSGKDIPRGKDWNDPAYRDWIRWNYDRRLEIWDLNNRTTKAAGGPDCIWAGMNSGSISGQCQSFRDYKAICERADLIMLDTRLNGRDLQLAPKGGVAEFPANDPIVNDPNRTLIGFDQEAWLNARLSASKQRGAVWRLIGQQVMMAQLSNSFGTTYLNPDQWDGYRPARERLYSHLRDNYIDNVVVMTGAHVWIDPDRYRVVRPYLRQSPELR